LESPAFKLIVGLGNPGSKYEYTRHNAGFWLADRLAEQNQVLFGNDSRGQGMVARLNWGGKIVYICKPMQYMNNSGSAVSALANYYKVAPSEILVAHDELDLQAGVVRLKKGGGHGGHNGLRDIIAKLGSSDFARVRLGIGHPGHKAAVVGYVLNEPSQLDGVLLQKAIESVVEQIPSLLAGEWDLATRTLHKS
jgi:PTH1 family peptidyl-tRNA hydrolase